MFRHAYVLGFGGIVCKRVDLHVRPFARLHRDQELRPTSQKKSCEVVLQPTPAAIQLLNKSGTSRSVMAPISEARHRE
jgi:hypothetical protein